MSMISQASSKYFRLHSVARRGLSIFSRTDGGEHNSAAWHKAMADAEKVVGFPTSFLSLRALLNEDFQGLAAHVKKLLNIKHPLLDTAKDIVFDSKNYMQTRGLVVLLLSKAANPTFDYGKNNQESLTETYNKQKALAEITELIHVAFLVHRGIVNRSTVEQPVKDVIFGNRLAVLGGDFMLSTACVALAKLENTHVVQLISGAIRDMSTALVMMPEVNDAFVGVDQVNHLLIGTDNWRKVVRLASGSLLSKACHSALLLAGDSDVTINAANLFTDNLVLAWQARNDLNRFTSKANIPSPNFSPLCTLPVAMIAEKCGGIASLLDLEKESHDDVTKFDFEQLHAIVGKDKEVLKATNDVCTFHVDQALKNLTTFPDSEAKSALERIAYSVK